MSLVPMHDLLEWWKQLGDIPVNDDGDILEPFRQFPRGTFREDIWHWFEASHPNFVVGEVMAGKFQ